MGKLTAAEIEEIADLIVEKVESKKKQDGIEFATVVSVTTGEGLVPYVEVQLAADLPGQTRTICSLMGAMLYPGVRVAILWDKPSGAYVIGSTDVLSVPLGRMSTRCSYVEGV